MTILMEPRGARVKALPPKSAPRRPAAEDVLREIAYVLHLTHAAKRAMPGKKALAAAMACGG
jgi:hypothetical protein